MRPRTVLRAYKDALLLCERAWERVRCAGSVHATVSWENVARKRHGQALYFLTWLMRYLAESEGNLKATIKAELPDLLDDFAAEYESLYRASKNGYYRMRAQDARTWAKRLRGEG